jgi:hypothetical protein
MVGMELNKIFVSMAKFITIICIIALRTTIDWMIHQINVKIVF